ILSLSEWRDEKALVRWRTQAMHHGAQEKGRFEVFLGYRLRVGQVTHDTHVPDGHALAEQRLDETEVGEGTTVALIDAKRPAEWVKNVEANDVAAWLGLKTGAAGLVSWDVFDAVLSPGDVILLMCWRDKDAAEAFGNRANLPAGGRMRRIRIVRDYGMTDRREAPQDYPEVKPVASASAPGCCTVVTSLHGLGDVRPG